MPQTFGKDIQYAKFCAYGFLKNLKFYEAFLVLFFLDKGLSFFEIGILYAIREIVTNILEIPTGVIADVVGRRKTMIQSFAAYIISFGVFYFADGFWVIVIAMVIFSIGDAFRSGTHKAMIFEYLKLNSWEDQKVHYYGHTRSWSQIGSAVSSLLAAGIVFYSGSYSLIFLLTGIPYLFDLLLMVSYPAALDGETSAFDRKKIWQAFGMVWKNFLGSFKSLEVFRAMGSLSVYSGYFKAIRDYLQPVIQGLALAAPILLYLENEKRTALLVGFIYFLIFLITSFSSRRSGRFADLFPNLKTPLNLSLAFGLFAGVLAGVFYFLEWHILSVIFFLLIYVIENLRKPIAISLVTDMFNKNILATVLSVESQATSLLAAIVAPLIGWLADTLGLGLSIVIISGMLLLLSPLAMPRRKAF